MDICGVVLIFLKAWEINFFGEGIRRPGALLYKHSGNFYGRKGENEGEIQKASKKGKGKEEREKGPIRPVLLPALPSLSSKTEKEAVQEKMCKCFKSSKGLKCCTACLPPLSAPFRLNHWSLIPSVPNPLSLWVASSGGFLWRLETGRHVGCGFCLLGAKRELAEPTVCLHCVFLTPLGPSPCSCSRLGRGKTVGVRMVPVVSLKAGFPEELEQDEDGDGPRQSSDRSWRFWQTHQFFQKSPRIQNLTEMQKRRGGPDLTANEVGILEVRSNGKERHLTRQRRAME